MRATERRKKWAKKNTKKENKTITLVSVTGNKDEKRRGRRRKLNRLAATRQKANKERNKKRKYGPRQRRKRRMRMKKKKRQIKDAFYTHTVESGKKK